MVFQGYSLFPHKTVGENIGFGLKMQGVDAETRRERVEDILEVIDLLGYSERYPDELSGGQQQRVALARALIIEPTVLLLDEPLAALDLKLRKQMRSELTQIHNRYDITTIYVTHDQEEALEMSDRVLVMNEGEAQQTSSPMELYNTPKNRFVADFIGETNLAHVEVETVNGEYGVELSSGVTLPVSRDNIQVEDLSPGDVALLNVRPEELEVTLEQSSDTNIPGTITELTFIGKTTKLLVDIGGWELMIGVSGRRAGKFEEGQEVYIEWDKHSATLLGES